MKRIKARNRQIWRHFRPCQPVVLALFGALMAEPRQATADAGSPAARPIHLEPLGPARVLPSRIAGVSAGPWLEQLVGNPKKIAALGTIAPAIVRFPGGSNSNFYDWKTGLQIIPERPTSSVYVKFWAEQLEPKIDRLFPKGIRFEDYAPMANAIGAETILVSNLETASVEDQTAWLRHLATLQMVPKSIELGNEFWLAMNNDPESLRRWPNESGAMAIMHRYEQAMRPLVGPGTKFAVQAAASDFHADPGTTDPLYRRLFAWDAALRPDDWFEAVTIHLYPKVAPLRRLPGGDTHEGLFRYLMARCDGGVDRALGSLISRMPGKDVWVTEWNGQDSGFWGASGPLPVTPPMSAQATTRMLLAMLRHPEVTHELFFRINFDDTLLSYFVHGPDGAYRPESVAEILTWFDHAANGGARFQRLVDRGAAPVKPGVSYGDAYRTIEGALFSAPRETTLILQNSAPESRAFDPTDNGRLPSPKSVDIIALSDLADSVRRAVRIDHPASTGTFMAPGFSVIRVVWNQPLESL